MICDFCKKQDAVVFIELNGDGGKKHINLCRECAAKSGITGDPKSITSIFKELTTISRQISEADKKVCSVCGTKLALIKSSKKAGCPECYSIFKNEIRELLEKEGIKGSYSGKMPKRLATFRSVLTDRIALQGKLEESLKNEDYEKAAVYRDYLRALEKSPVNGNDDE